MGLMSRFSTKPPSIQAAFPDAHGSPHWVRHVTDYVAKNTRAKILSTGDLITRGRHNREVITTVTGLVDKGSMVALAGNHEMAFLLAMRGNADAFSNFLLPDNGGMSLMEELAVDPQDMSSNFWLRSISDWMANKLKLYFFDNDGTLYLHAGIPLKFNGEPDIFYKRISGLECLPALQADMTRALKDNNPSHPVFRVLCSSSHSLLWDKSWIDTATQMAAQYGINEVMAKLGTLEGRPVNRLVFGHIRGNNILNIGNRIFGIDVGMHFGRHSAVFINQRDRVILEFDGQQEIIKK